MDALKLDQVTTLDFKDKVIDSEMPVLVDFWAEWCGPCQMLMPTLERLAEEFTGRIKVVKVNTDESPETAGLYKISAIPATNLFVRGSVVESLVGVQPYETYRSAIEKNL